MTRAPTAGRTPAERATCGLKDASAENPLAAVRALVVELAHIAAAEDDAAERRRDVATPCSTR